MPLKLIRERYGDYERVALHVSGTLNGKPVSFVFPTELIVTELGPDTRALISGLNFDLSMAEDGLL